jgi:hypothetical protein
VINETTIGPFFKAKSDDEHRSWSVTPFAMSKFPDEVRQARSALSSQTSGISLEIRAPNHRSMMSDSPPDWRRKLKRDKSMP